MLLTLSLNALAQKVELHLIPDSPTATYRTGEQAKMKVIALDCGVAIYDAEVSYEVSEDLMPAREKSTVKLKGPEAVIKVGTMRKAGFLRVRAKIEHVNKYIIQPFIRYLFCSLVFALFLSIYKLKLL